MHDLKKAFLPMAAAMVAVGVLLLKEPDFGAFVVIISIAIGILFLGGIQLFCIGILGQYLSKTYLETKHRPIYITREKE